MTALTARTNRTSTTTTSLSSTSNSKPDPFPSLVSSHPQLLSKSTFNSTSASKNPTSLPFIQSLPPRPSTAQPLRPPPLSLSSLSLNRSPQFNPSSLKQIPSPPPSSIHFPITVKPLTSTFPIASVSPSPSLNLSIASSLPLLQSSTSSSSSIGPTRSHSPHSPTTPTQPPLTSSLPTSQPAVIKTRTTSIQLAEARKTILGLRLQVDDLKQQSPTSLPVSASLPINHDDDSDASVLKPPQPQLSPNPVLSTDSPLTDLDHQSTHEDLHSSHLSVHIPAVPSQEEQVNQPAEEPRPQSTYQPISTAKATPPSKHGPLIMDVLQPALCSLLS